MIETSEHLREEFLLLKLPSWTTPLMMHCWEHALEEMTVGSIYAFCRCCPSDLLNVDWGAIRNDLTSSGPD